MVIVSSIMGIVSNIMGIVFSIMGIVFSILATMSNIKQCVQNMSISGVSVMCVLAFLPLLLNDHFLRFLKKEVKIKNCNLLTILTSYQSSTLHLAYFLIVIKIQIWPRLGFGCM